MSSKRGTSRRRIIVEHDPCCGSFLDTEIERCINAAKLGDQHLIPGPAWARLMARKHYVVVMNFNGVRLALTAQSTVAAEVAKYHAEIERRSEKFRNSPEGRRQAARAAARLAAALADLDSLDWDSVEAVVNWLCRVTPAFDHGGVNYPREELVARFAEHGYLPNVNCGEDYIADDLDNSGRWLIGQALDGIAKVGAPHPMTVDFGERWREQFGLTPMANPYGHDEGEEED